MSVPGTAANGPSASFARSLQIAVGVAGVVALAAGIWLLVDASDARAWLRAGELEGSEIPSSFVAIFVYLIPFAVAAVLWLIWQFRATQQAWGTGRLRSHESPGWAIAWWFIPYANYVMPALTVRSLRRAALRPSDEGTVSGGWIVWAWWGLYQSGVLVGFVVWFWQWSRLTALQTGSDPVVVEETLTSMFRYVFVAMGATLLGQSLAAVPAIVLIGQIQHGLATLAERSIPPRPDGMFAA